MCGVTDFVTCSGVETWTLVVIKLQSKLLEGHTKTVLLIRGTYILSVLVNIVYMS